jgi:hypothetical protein
LEERAAVTQQGEPPAGARMRGAPVEGEHVWVEGREARFLYLHPKGAAAAIRYLDERAARVVPARKIELGPSTLPG